MPFRRTIWKYDERYRIDCLNLPSDQIEAIARIQSIDAAKKRTPPIPVADAIKMFNLLEQVPKDCILNPKEFHQLVSKMDSWGAGIKTTVCIIAVMTDGRYPPLDKKIVHGARIRGIITAEEEKVLNGANLRSISEVYINKLVPLWTRDVERIRDPERVDKEWSS